MQHEFVGDPLDIREAIAVRDLYLQRVVDGDDRRDPEPGPSPLEPGSS